MDLAFQMVVVPLVLGALAFAARYLRTRGPLLAKTPGAPLEAAGRIQLTPQHGLHIVRFGERHLLVATHPSGCVVLDSAAAPQEKAQ